MKEGLNSIISVLVLSCLLLTTVPVPALADATSFFNNPDSTELDFEVPGIDSEQAGSSTVELPEEEVFIFSKTVYPDTGAIIEYENVILDIPSGAVSEPTDITIENLIVVHPLPVTFSNVTDGAAGYRFGPHGMTFSKDIKVCLPFTPKIAESETALSNLFTYFYNENTTKWERLKKVTVDRENYRIISSTNHFTDMVNTTLKLPELPQGVDFNLNSIKELKAADPMTEIPGLKGLEPNNTGSASFAIPFRLPGGRGNATPELGLQYSSDTPTGWVGRGFDINIPRISIDTRFGLPEYTKEDTYMLNGEKLLLYREAAGYDVYRPAREHSFQEIRHVYDGYDINYWTVTGKDGSIQYFGQSQGWLGPERTDKSRVFTWYLTRVVDNNGNLVDYTYIYDADNAYTYLRQIRYSGYTDGSNIENGPYTVTFEQEDRPDRRIDSRGRFVSKCTQRLTGMVIAYNSTPVRRYSFYYTENIFGQSELTSYSEEDGEGNVFYTYGFDYYELPEHRDLADNLLGYDGFTEEKQWGGGGSANLKGLDEKISCSLGGSLYAGVHIYRPKLFGRKTLFSFGVRGGVNFGMDFSKSMMMDVNGDGLPDMTWKEGSTLYSYLNTIDETTGENYFDAYNPYTISGISELLNMGTQAGFSLGLSAQLLNASGAICKQYNWTESGSTLADINGDGLVDIVDAGSSFWKRNTGENRFSDEPWNFGEDNTSITDDISPAQQDEFNRTYYRQEPLRRWKAYVPGRVRIENDIDLLDGYSVSSDGVDADTYTGGVIHSIHLDRDNVSVIDSFTEEVNRDEAVYFHLSTGDDHRGDALSWDTTIRYESIALFDGLKDAAILSPPSQTTNNQLPGNDSRLAPLYTRVTGETSSYYELRDDWRNRCNRDVYDAIAAGGLFIPRKVPFDLFLKLFNEASNIVPINADYSPRAQLILGYNYVPEKQTFYYTNSIANNVVLSLGPSVWTEAEKRQLMFSTWIDGQVIYPSSGGTTTTFTQARNSTPVQKIYPRGSTVSTGEYVQEKGYLVDRIYDPADKSQPLYSLWLTYSPQGSWEAIRDETSGEFPEPDAVSVTQNTIQILRGGITSEYRFTGLNHLIEEIPADLYNEVVDAAFMAGSVFSGMGISEITPALYNQVYSGLGETDRLTFEAAYLYNEETGVYQLDSEGIGTNYLTVLGWLDYATEQSGSVFNNLETGNGTISCILQLSEDEFNTFIDFFQAETGTVISSWFNEHVIPGATEDDPDITWYAWNDTADEEAARIAFYSFHRDYELFPYYVLSGDTYILKETPPPHAPSSWQDIVESVWQAAGYHVWNNLQYRCVFNPTDMFTVENGYLEPGDTFLPFAPETTGEPGDEAGIVTFISLDDSMDTIITRVCVPVFNAALDYDSTDYITYPEEIFSMEEEIVDPINPGQELPEMDLVFDVFSGGKGGWAYNLWCGYHPFDISLIGTYPEQNENTEVVVPAYTIDVVRNYDTETGRAIISNTGKNNPEPVSTDAWVGEVSGYSEPFLDDYGNNTISNYTFAAFMYGSEMHPGRKGGDAYYLVPRGSGITSGGTLSTIMKSKSDSTDINGGISIDLPGTSIGTNFSLNNGISSQYAGLMDLNGDQYPDLLVQPQDGGSNGTFAKGNNGGFSDTEDITLPFDELSKFRNTVFGFGVSAGSGGSGITFAMNAKAKMYQSMVQQAEEEGSGGIGIGGGVNGTLGQSIRNAGLLDINGDGLPDYISRSGSGDFTVQLNTGITTPWVSSSWAGGMDESLAGWPSYTNSSETIEARSEGMEYSNTGSFGGNVTIGVGPATVTGGFNGSINKTIFRLADVNGDGLPDQVGKNADEPYFLVCFNLGDTFSDTAVRLYRPDWTIDVDNVLSDAVSHDLAVINGQMDGASLPDLSLDIPGAGSFPTEGNSFDDAVDPLSIDDTLDYSSGVSFSLGASLSLSWDWWLVALVITPGVNGSYASTSTSLGFRDLTGDNLPDHILKIPGEDFVRVKENLLGKTGLLKTVYLPAGGSTELEYIKKGNTTDFPSSKYVLSSVIHHDGMEDYGTAGSVHSYTSSFEYENGYYDREKRDFYGFEFVRTLFADNSYRESRYYNRDYFRKGLPASDRFYGPEGRLYTETENQYNPRTYFCLNDEDAVFQALTSVAERYFGEDRNNYTERQSSFEYDSYGNISVLNDLGSVFTDNDNYRLVIDYADLPGYRHSYPEEMNAYNAGGDLIRRRQGLYDNKGNQTGIRHYITRTTYASYTLSYDRYGNPLRFTGPNGLTNEITYDTEIHSLPVQIDVYNTSNSSYQYRSFMEWDYTLGLNTASIDQNNNREERTYDSFGRLIAVFTPYDTGEVPAVSFEYHTEDGIFPWYAITENKLRFEPADSQVMQTLVYSDGMGRQIMTAKQGETGHDAGRRTGWNCSGALVYDSKGRVVSQGQSVFSEGNSLPSFPELARPVETTYDCMNRVIRKHLPDGADIFFNYTVANHNIIITTTDPLGNSTESVKGARDEVLVVRKKDEGGNVLTSSSYSYNPLQEITRARDHFGNSYLFTYDLAGNRRTIMSPDAGLVELFYDTAGNLVRKIDANLRSKGQAITYQYDGFNRMVLINYPRMEDVRYEYGEPGAAYNRTGRLVQLEDESGTTVYQYGDMGETTRLERTLNRLTPLSDAKTAILEYRSDYLGRMESILYPDGELIEYSYDSGGQITGVTGTHRTLVTDYVEEIGYNEQGQRIYIRLGNGTETVYTYNEDRRWLDSIRTVNSSNRIYQDIIYNFNSVGHIDSYSNVTDFYETAQEYTYDAMYQLTDVTGTYEARPHGVREFRSTYQQSFSYNAIGNMHSKNSEVTNSPSVSRGQNLNYSLDYMYYPDKPHQAERIGNLWYRYDANGNVTEEREGGHSPSGDPNNGTITQDGDLYILNYGFGLIRHDEDEENVYTRTFTWDEENRLKRSVDDVATVDYQYDSSGNRTVKHTESGESLYFDAMWSITTDYPDFRQCKHIYIGESRVATKLNIEGDGSVGYEEVNTYYYHTDHLGSAQLITDYEGGIYEHIEYTPYGELWIEEKSENFDKIPFRFTGKELDEETGFVYYGARYLSPKTGRWLGVDPALEQYLPVPGNDQQSRSRNSRLPNAGIYNHFNLSPYAYCNNNPIIYTDPDGNCPLFVITGLIGAAAGAVAGGVISYMETGEVDWGAVAVGAVIGGAIGVTGGAAVAYLSGAGVTASAGAVWTALAGTGTATGAWLSQNLSRFNQLLTQVRQVLSQIRTTVQEHHWICKAFVDKTTRWFHQGISTALSKLGIDLTKISWNLSGIPHGGRHLDQYMNYVKTGLENIYKAYIASGQSWSAGQMEAKLQDLVLKIMEGIANGTIKMNN